MRTIVMIAILALTTGPSWASDSDWAPRTQDELYRVREQHQYDQKVEEKRRHRAEEKRLKAEADTRRRQAYQDCLQARQTTPGLVCNN
jgi:hypothetical protein